MYKDCFFAELPEVETAPKHSRRPHCVGSSGAFRMAVCTEALIMWDELN